MNQEIFLSPFALGFYLGCVFLLIATYNYLPNGLKTGGANKCHHEYTLKRHQFVIVTTIAGIARNGYDLRNAYGMGT